MKRVLISSLLAGLAAGTVFALPAHADDDAQEMEALVKQFGFITLEQASAKAQAAKNAMSKARVGRSAAPQSAKVIVATIKAMDDPLMAHGNTLVTLDDMAASTERSNASCSAPVRRIGRRRPALPADGEGNADVRSPTAIKWRAGRGSAAKT